MRRHLIDWHFHGHYVSHAELNSHRVYNDNNSRWAFTPRPSGGINLNAHEFSGILSGLTDMIGRNVNSGIGNVLGVANMLNNIQNSNNQLPFKPNNAPKTIKKREKSSQSIMPKPILISDSESDEETSKLLGYMCVFLF